MNVKLKSILIYLTYVLIVLFLCEFLIYYITIYLCKWPQIESIDSNVKQSNPSLKAMILADIHILGYLRGHWFDRLRREWQMWRSFQTSLQLLSPDLVIILGDIFDEGLYASDQDFDKYVKRFHHLFYINSNNTKLIVIVGNHDIGFHYWTDKYLRRRFENTFNITDVDLIEAQNGVYFVAINSIALEGDNCYLCANAVNKLKKIGQKLRQNKIFPIVLIHFPLYRQSEQICTESDSAPHEEKSIRYRERMDCLSRESTQFLLDELNPRLVLSGHSHHSCVVRHETHNKVITEWTVASFSWRNKKNPSFLLTTFSSDNYLIYKCFLPNESLVFGIYLICFITLFCFNVCKVYVKYLKKQKSH